jgi:hypothetical protein
MGLLLIGFLLDGDLRWLAGIVIQALHPENSNMMIPNVYLDWISVSALQNHLPMPSLRGAAGRS